MANPTLADFREALPDLHAVGLRDEAGCPSCHKGVLTVGRLAGGQADPSCSGGCAPGKIRDAVRALLILGRAPKNGAKAPEASVVSVVTPIAPRRHDKTVMEVPDEAWYGLPGRVMRTIAPHTESHPAGVLGSFLAGGGCWLGPGPYVYRDGQRHGTNEFILLLARTGAGRKGSASRQVDNIWKAIFNSDDTSQYDISANMHESDPTPWRLLTVKGLGSGEALVAALADDGPAPGEPRRLIFESEFARCLKAMAREGSTLSDMLKSAWDSESLQARTKGKTLSTQEAHVAMLAHSTQEDVRERLGQVELFNGFANRFLWIGTQKARSLPFGGGKAPLAGVVAAVYAGIAHARTVQQVEFDADAKQIWETKEAGGFGVYDLFGCEHGLLGAVTDRGAAHVTRLALQYALWDRKREIQVPHLLAALAVWELSLSTCADFFGRSTGDRYADTIIERLLEAEGGFLTRKEIRDLFQRNAEPGRIPAALDLLEQLGKIERAKMPTEGAPAEIVSLSAHVRNDRNDLSPLSAGRAAARMLGYTTETTEGPD